MLHAFITTHRQEVIERCVTSMVNGGEAPDTAAAMEHGVPQFLDQLVDALKADGSRTHVRKTTPTPPTASDAAISHTAAQHGNELLRVGFSVEQVVHHYGDVCQAVTELAIERGQRITNEEFKTLNRSLDYAIADAVGEFGRQRDLVTERDRQTPNERLGALAHELRNLLNAAVLSFEAVKTAQIGVNGAVGTALGRSLMGMQALIDRSLAAVRLTEESPVPDERILMRPFIQGIHILAAMEARVKGLELKVDPVDPSLAIDGDRHLLSSAVMNLLQNAFKFTHAHGHTHVALRVRGDGERVSIDIEDECGGLPPGTSDRLFRPFVQRGNDRSGLGLGLSISQRSVEANHGRILVRDLPGKGCVFTIELPQGKSEN
jgi:signal transduction histidine kinase